MLVNFNVTCGECPWTLPLIELSSRTGAAWTAISTKTITQSSTPASAKTLKERHTKHDIMLWPASRRMSRVLARFVLFSGAMP